ncbi:MAG: hypothetical protein HUK15_08945 [Bacteroidales bacterium]|nr:hypothetical protein [Bacteroidales bacterium]
MKTILKKSLFIGLAVILNLTSVFAQSEENEKEKIEHRFTRLGIEVRADFDYQNLYRDLTFSYTDYSLHTDTTNLSQDYGFVGKYFNLHLGGEFGRFSYYFRQRVIANRGSVSFFDNTDFLYLHCNINDNWGVRFGKEALAIGGYEYDAAPIDVLYYSQYWGNIYCFQIAASVSYTDNSKKNKLILQVANSPYVYYMGSGSEWKKGLLSYNLYWSGNFNHFSTLYSFNMFERERGKFMGQVALGNKISFDKFSLYLDYFQKVTDTKKFFNDFSVISRLDVRLKDVNIFAKGGYEQNKSEFPDLLSSSKDILMYPGSAYGFYGIGVEYRPAFYKNIRLHAFVANSIRIQQNEISVPTEGIYTTGKTSKLNVNVGLSWNIDFLKFIDKKFKKS